MKKIIMSFMLVLASLPVLADNASDARKALDKASSIITSGTGAQASFTISGNNIGKQKGKISIKGNRFCAQTPSATVWYDGKTQWTYLKANNEVNVSSASASRQQTLNPYAFVSMYKKGYKLSMQKTTTAITVRMQAIGNQSIRDMYVTLDGKYKPTQIKLNQGKGWTVIKISSFTKKNLPNSTFVFNHKDFPTAEVIDLR